MTVIDLIRGLAALAWLGTMSAAPAQTVLERAERDEIVRIAKGDPAMVAAIRQARATLPAFLALADRPREDTRNFSVKIGLAHGADDREYVWIRPFARKGRKFVGRLVNTPRMVAGMRYGDMIPFSERDIVDWNYLDGDGGMQGNFTACALLTKETPKDREAFMQRYKLRCDF